MKNFVLGFAALAALLIGGIAVVHPGGADAAAPIRTSLACSPLTTDQNAKPGDIQTCRIRVTNQSGAALSGVTVSHNSKFTPAGATVCFGASCADKTDFTGQALTIPNFSSALITYTYVRGGPYQDGLRRTEACAHVSGFADSCGLENKSLP